MAGNLPDSTPVEIQNKLSDIERLFQRIQHKIFTVAPLLNEVPRGGFVIARISGTTFIYTRVEDQLSRVSMTDV